MNRSKCALLALLVSGLAVCLSAQDQAKFEEWMKSTGAANNALRKLETKTGPEAAENAEKISAVYGNMIEYWREKNVTDALKLSEEGKAAATELSTAAKAGDAEKAAAAYTKIGATCRPCHDAHRERLPDGKYKIK